MKTKPVIAAPALLLIVFILMEAITVLPADVFGTDSDPYITASLLQLFIIALPTVVFARLRGKGYSGRMRLRPFTARHVAIIIFALGFLFFGSSGLSYVLHLAFPQSEVVTTYETNGGMLGGFYVILTMAVLPAITEELLFRGVICAEYESCGMPAAIILSSLSFAMFHFSFVRLPVYLFGGFVLVLVLYATRSVFASMVVHILYNTATIFFGDLIYRVVSSQGLVMFGFLLVTLSVVFAILTFGEAERLYAGYAEKNEPSGYVVEKKNGGGAAGLAKAAFSPLYTALIVLYIVAAAINVSR